MTRVLITGGAGFIGSHTCDLLLSRNYEVRVLDCLQPRVHPRGRPAYLPTQVEFVQADVQDRRAWQGALSGVRYVFHLAAYQDYMPDFSTFIGVNTYSTALLFEVVVAKKLPVDKIVLASSQSVYGEGRYRCDEHGMSYPGPRPLEQLSRGQWEHICPRCGRNLHPVAFDETVVYPHTGYGISKYASELLGIELGRRYGIPTVALRYSIVQGPRNSLHNAYSGICRSFTQLLLNNKPPVIYEDGKQLRDYIHVRDVAAAHLLMLERSETNFEVFNVGGSRAVSVLEFTKILTAACGSSLAPVLRGEFRVGDTRHTVSDSSKLRRLGWAPAHSVERIIEDYVTWVREQREIPDNYEQAARAMRENGVLRPVAVQGYAQSVS